MKIESKNNPIETNKVIIWYKNLSRWYHIKPEFSRNSSFFEKIDNTTGKPQKFSQISELFICEYSFVSRKFQDGQIN